MALSLIQAPSGAMLQVFERKCIKTSFIPITISLQSMKPQVRTWLLLKTMQPQPDLHRPAGHHEGDAEVEVQPGRPDVHRLRDGHEHPIHLLRKEPRWPLVHSMSTNWGWNDQGQGYYSSSRHNITNQWSRNLRICCRPSCLKYCMPYWNLSLI